MFIRTAKTISQIFGAETVFFIKHPLSDTGYVGLYVSEENMLNFRVQPVDVDTICWLCNCTVDQLNEEM